MEEQVVYTEVLSFKRKETIFREGDPGGCTYEIRSGRVAIVAGYGTEREQVLTELGEGSFFGEMGMVRGFPRSATAVAQESGTEVAVITWETLGRYFQEKPAKVVQMMQQMGKRINELSDSYVEACGAVATLYEQRVALMRENKQQSKTIQRLSGLRAGAEGEADEPLWAKIEDQIRYNPNEGFEKNLDAYRRSRQKKRC